MSAVHADDYVICSKHNTRRRVHYCEQMPIYNADHVVVETHYVCREDQMCTVAAREKNGRRRVDSREVNGASTSSAGLSFDCSSTNMTSSKSCRRECASAIGTVEEADISTTRVFDVTFAKRPQDDDASDKDGLLKEVPSVHGDVTFSSTTSPVTVASPTSTPGPRSAPRYYDMIQRGTGETAVKKVCWHCGLSGHEKPNCPNMLCRTCHGKRPPYVRYHRCDDVSISPFVVVPTTLPKTADGMDAVRCVSCSQYGHFDCSVDSMPMKRVLTCCFCADRGHSGYDCPVRSRDNPDRWVQRQMQQLHGGYSGRTYCREDNTQDSMSNYNSRYASGSSQGHQAYNQRGFDNEYNRRHMSNSGQGIHTSRDSYRSNGLPHSSGYGHGGRGDAVSDRHVTPNFGANSGHHSVHRDYREGHEPPLRNSRFEGRDRDRFSRPEYPSSRSADGYSAGRSWGRGGSRNDISNDDGYRGGGHKYGPQRSRNGGDFGGGDHYRQSAQGRGGKRAASGRSNQRGYSSGDDLY